MHAAILRDAREERAPRDDGGAREIAGDTIAMASTNRLSPIPHPPKKPVVGNMLSVDSSTPIQHMTRMARELGPIFCLDMMGTPLVVVSGHDLVDELSDEQRFDKAVNRSPPRLA